MWSSTFVQAFCNEIRFLPLPLQAQVGYLRTNPCMVPKNRLIQAYARPSSFPVPTKYDQDHSVSRDLVKQQGLRFTCSWSTCVRLRRYMSNFMSIEPIWPECAAKSRNRTCTYGNHHLLQQAGLPPQAGQPGWWGCKRAATIELCPGLLWRSRHVQQATSSLFLDSETQTQTHFIIEFQTKKAEKKDFIRPFCGKNDQKIFTDHMVGEKWSGLIRIKFYPPFPLFTATLKSHRSLIDLSMQCIYFCSGWDDGFDNAKDDKSQSSACHLQTKSFFFFSKALP